MKLVAKLRRDIDSAKIVEDGKLPTLRQLAGRYKCGVTSVKRAFDELEREGILRVVRGQGNFVLSDSGMPMQKKSRILGAILCNGEFMSELEAVREQYLRLGWLFSIYDSSADRQSPEMEKLFLESASKQNFSVFIVAASPREPVNRDLFMRLRSKGCKVIHISNYVDDMSDECFFLCDLRQAAELAVWKIAVAGYRNVLFVNREDTAPHVRLIRKGVDNVVADAGLTLLDTFTVHHKEAESILRHLEKLPPDTAVLCFDTELGEIVQWCATRLGLAAPRDFGLVSVINVFGVNAGHSHTQADTAKIVRDVLACAIDEKISPFDKVQKFYRCTFCDRGTLKSPPQGNRKGAV